MYFPAIQVEGLNIVLGGQQILSDVHLHIDAGEMIFIFGPNGGGKTTLVRAIMGLVPKQSGVIKIFGEENVPAIVAKNIAYVPQYSTIDRTFPVTVYEVMEMTYPNLTKREITKALAYMEMQHYAQCKINSLSGGEFQRLLIVRALLNSPKILILDEPTNNLDAKTQERLYQLIQIFNKRSKLTVIVITHDISVISSIAQRVIGINRHIEYAGSPREMLSPKILKKVYGVPLLKYVHEHGLRKHHHSEKK